MAHKPGKRISEPFPRLEYLLKQGQHGVLMEAIPAKISVLPPPQLELARTHRSLHVDAGFGEPLQMFSLQLGVHDVEGLVPTVEAVFDERAQHPVLLVHAVEECANVTMLTETAPGTLHRAAVRCHISPPGSTDVDQSRSDASEQVILVKRLAQVSKDAGRESLLPNAGVRIRRD